MASSTEDRVRVVGKARYDEQTFLPLATLPDNLAPSSVRVQAKLVGITSNNLSYCAAGTLLHWWDTFPVPSTLASPYNDRQQYGIAPAWGFARVLASTISGLPENTWLYGFFPTSSHPVDLQLEQSPQLSDSWIETSASRAKVMELYQRYFVVPETSITPWAVVVKPIWEAGYVMERYVLSSSFSTSKDDPQTIHPMSLGVPLSANDADLSGSLVVCLAAGTKTNRAFLEFLVRRKTSLPAGIIEVTGSSGQGVRDYAQGVEFSFEHKVIPYAAMKDASSFQLEGSRAQISKVLVFDFGARDMSLPVALEAIGKAHPQAKIVNVSIGGEAKAQSPEELGKRRHIHAQATNLFRLNTSGIRTALIERLGEEQYFKEYNSAWEAVLKRQLEGSNGARVLGVSMTTLKGLKGAEGLEGVWNRLCQGQLPGDEGIAVDLDA